jgi:hypothetical protein
LHSLLPCDPAVNARSRRPRLPLLLSGMYTRACMYVPHTLLLHAARTLTNALHICCPLHSSDSKSHAPPPAKRAKAARKQSKKKKKPAASKKAKVVKKYAFANKDTMQGVVRRVHVDVFMRVGKYVCVYTYLYVLADRHTSSQADESFQRPVRHKNLQENSYCGRASARVAVAAAASACLLLPILLWTAKSQRLDVVDVPESAERSLSECRCVRGSACGARSRVLYCAALLSARRRRLANTSTAPISVGSDGNQNGTRPGSH